LIRPTNRYWDPYCLHAIEQCTFELEVQSVDVDLGFIASFVKPWAQSRRTRYGRSAQEARREGERGTERDWHIDMYNRRLVEFEVSYGERSASREVFFRRVLGIGTNMYQSTSLDWPEVLQTEYKIVWAQRHHPLFGNLVGGLFSDNLRYGIEDRGTSYERLLPTPAARLNINLDIEEQMLQALLTCTRASHSENSLASVWQNSQIADDGVLRDLVSFLGVVRPRIIAQQQQQRQQEPMEAGRAKRVKLDPGA
jgi:hypothetical protein